MPFILERVITTTSPKQKDYYNGKEISIWTSKKNEAHTFVSIKSASDKRRNIRAEKFETYPINIVPIKKY